jgi:UDP-glucuronate decarboxylase
MSSPNDFYGPVNLGNPGEFTIFELANKIIKLTGSKSKLMFQPLPADDPRQRRPDITLARAKLGWSPKIDLERGLISTISYFRNILKISQ